MKKLCLFTGAFLGLLTLLVCLGRHGLRCGNWRFWSFTKPPSVIVSRFTANWSSTYSLDLYQGPKSWHMIMLHADWPGWTNPPTTTVFWRTCRCDAVNLDWSLRDVNQMESLRKSLGSNGNVSTIWSSLPSPGPAAP